MKNRGKLIGCLVGIWMVQFAFAQQLPEIRMVDIPAGSFYMGGEGGGENYDELPIHKVNITHPFKMSATEITNASLKSFARSIRPCGERMDFRWKMMKQSSM